jgi:hypothetical protein
LPVRDETWSFGEADMRNKAFDATVIVVLALLALAVAYVCFEVLNSQADGESYGFVLQGAIAAWVVSFTLFTSVYLQFRKSDDKELHERIEELQQKLIRGAPHPSGFETEVAERERIVLARPHEWKHGAGIVFYFQLPPEEGHDQYELTPEFRCTYAPISENLGPNKLRFRNVLKSPNNKAIAQDPRKQFYKSYQETLEKRKRQSVYESYSCEYIHVGEDAGFVPSLKVVTHEYAAITARKPDPLTGSKRTPKWTKVTREQYESLPKARSETADAPAPSEAARARARGGGAVRVAGSNGQTETAVEGEIVRPEVDTADPTTDLPPRGGRVLHVMIICYHADLKKVFYFEFWDKPDTFVESSAKFNQIMDSVRFLT